MKAFHTRVKHETGEEAIHEIVFAESHSQAKYNSQAYGEVDWVDISAKRAPQYDQFAEQGFIPLEYMLTMGWLVDCDSCKASLCAEHYKDGKAYCSNCIEGGKATLDPRGGDAE